jgi:accessory colonization factor AcfC
MSKEEQKKYDTLSLKEQVIQVKKDSPKMIKYFDEWKKQD